ncbi:hypothetical protein NEF87_004799 [Candidatus Lokiarchaeum ossiferum]|uniref:DEAD/DEAH box helicase n=1 Tax=Candidatus Lokiarchaeum ossiferum TaxID=2951803 RepID=A0ABY6I116_9ARCH|nr:hypothetical protein NEF87_004799 [Candidatus Lokiarchaeum sp. B-35]
MERKPNTFPRFDPIALEGKTLRPKQKKAFTLLEQGQNVVANFEMGYGKTFLALKLAQLMKDKGKKFIMGVPLRAVASQMFDVFFKYFNVLIVSGDHVENKTKILDPDFDGYIMTYEMMLQYLIKERQRQILFDNIGAFIIDEVHIMVSGRRGATIESNIMLVQYFYPHIQQLLLSATIQNSKEFATHFKCCLVKTIPEERPVKLIKKIITRPVFSRMDEEYEQITEDIKEIIIKHTTPSANFPGMLVFCNARLLSKKLASELNKHFSHIQAEYHNASLSLKKRKAVEQAFSNQDINVICCTPTLAMGINLPSAICVLTSVRRRSGLLNEKIFLDSNEIIQMAGRAGRPGQKGNLIKTKNGITQEYGISYTMCEYTDYEEVEIMINTPVKICSQIPDFMKWMLLTWIVAGISQKVKLKKIYSQIFVSSVDFIKFKQEFSWLVEKNFISVDPMGQIIASHKARMTAFFGIKCETALHFQYIRECLKQEFWAGKIKSIHPATLFCLLLACEEFTSNIRTSEKNDIASITTANNFCDNSYIYHLLGETKFQRSQNEAVKKGFSITYDNYLQQRYLENSSPDKNEQVIFKKFDIGDKVQVQTIAARLLTAAHAILGTSWIFGKILRELTDGMSFSMACFDSDVIDLMKINNVGPRKAILIVEAKIKSRAQFYRCDTHSLYYSIKKIVHHRNERVKILQNHFSEKRDLWKSVSEKSLEKLRKGAITSKFPSIKNIQSKKRKEIKNNANSLLKHM